MIQNAEQISAAARKHGAVRLFRAVVLAAGCIAAAACSSAPKRPEVITDTYNLASVRLESGNTALAAADFTAAETHFAEAYRMALSIDNAGLLCRVLLSQVVWQCSVRTEQAYGRADGLLEQAVMHAGRSEEKEMLQVLCSVYGLYIASCRRSVPQDYAAVLASAEKKLAKEPYYLGFVRHTLGDCHMTIPAYDKAYDAYRSAAEIHKQHLYLQEIGNDWYAAASACSLAGRRQEALDALEKALVFDRNAENSAAIAADYFALAQVYKKFSSGGDDIKKAAAYAQYAAAMYRSIQYEADAMKCEQFANAILSQD